MNYPAMKTLRQWLHMIDQHIGQRQQRIENEGVEQRGFRLLALDYSWRAHVLLMTRAPTAEVLKNYRNAAQCVLKSFSMAYNRVDKDYVGELADWESVGKSEAVDGFHYAICARDYAIADALALLCCESPIDEQQPREVSYYAQGLRHCLLENFAAAAEYLKAVVEPHGSRLIIKRRSLYFLCCEVLLDILLCNEADFNKGLERIVECFKSVAEASLQGTPDEFICDEALALANLGLSHGLQLTFKSEYLPWTLLDTSHSAVMPQMSQAGNGSPVYV